MDSLFSGQCSVKVKSLIDHDLSLCPKSCKAVMDFTPHLHLCCVRWLCKVISFPKQLWMRTVIPVFVFPVFTNKLAIIAAFCL